MAGLLLRKGLRGFIRTTSAADNPPAGQRLLVPKSDGWYDRTSAGVETKFGAAGGFADPEAAPSYVGARNNPFDPETSWYNMTETSMLPIRSMLAKNDTQRVKLAFLGNSIPAGSYVTAIGKNDLAAQVRRFLKAEGTLINGTGLVFPANQPGISPPTPQRDYRYTSITGWTLSADTHYPYAYTTTNGAVISWTADEPGQTVEVITYDNTGPIQIAIDGVVQETYTGPNPGGGTTAIVRQFTGLPHTLHTVTVTTTSTTLSFVAAIQARNAAGLEVTNAAVGGGIVDSYWPYNFATWRPTLAVAGQPDIVVICLLGNNLWAGTNTATDAYNAILEITEYYQDLGKAPIIMIEPNLDNGVVAQAEREAWISAMYDVADDQDIPLLDCTHLFNSYAIADGLGLMGDIAHPNDAGHAVIARSFAQEVLKTMSYDTKTDPKATEYTKGTPAAPTNGLFDFTRYRARRLLATVDKYGFDTQYQPFIGSNRVCFLAPVNANAVLDKTGLPIPTAYTTAVAAVTAGVASMHDSMIRVRYPSVATANNFAGWRLPAQWQMSNVANRGGFNFTFRFIFNAVTATGRGFFGLSATNANMANADPTTLFNLIGLCYNTADTTMRIISNDASGTATTHRTLSATDFPFRTTGTPYEFRLSIASGIGNLPVEWSMHNLATGEVVAGIISTDLPAIHTLLAWHAWMNNVTASVVSFDMNGFYAETDN